MQVRVEAQFIGSEIQLGQPSPVPAWEGGDATKDDYYFSPLCNRDTMGIPGFSFEDTSSHIYDPAMAEKHLESQVRLFCKPTADSLLILRLHRSSGTSYSLRQPERRDI